MPFIAVTNTFSTGGTILASAHNQNFADLTNGLSDGTKDINIAALTATGATIGSLGGVVKATAGVISAATLVNADVSASAAIALSKLAALTASKAVVSDGSGLLSASSVTSTEIGYVSGVTSALQTQINALGISITTKTNTNYVILDNDGFGTILFSTGASDRTATLPTAANNTNRRITIKKTDSGAGKVTVTGTIDGVSNLDLLVQNDFVTLHCDGSTFYIVGKRLATRWQKKNLAADQTTDATMTDLSFTLEAGKTYRISPYFRTDVQDGAADPTVNVIIKDGVTEISRIIVTQVVSQQILEQSKSFIYAMTGTALTFVTSSASANSYILGSSDASGGAKSFVIVEELRDHTSYSGW